MHTLQKPKGFNLDRLLNDPMFMLGSLGVLGALVVTVWVVAGRSSSPGEEGGTAPGFQSDSSPSVRQAASATVASSLDVAKLKHAGPADSLKDAQGAAGSARDGGLNGTFDQIAAAAKAKDAKTGAKAAEIPTEVAGDPHVPGMAPDSTKLAGAPGAPNFGAPPGAASNPGYINSGGVGGPLPAGGAPQAGAADGAAGAPILASGPGAPAVAGRPFLRSQAGAGGHPVANFGGVPVRRVASGALGGGTEGSASAFGPDFGAAGGDFSRPGAEVHQGTFKGASGSGSVERPSVGGGAPAAPDLGSLGSGRGGLLGDGSSPGASSSASPASMASKGDLNQQAADHLSEAKDYRSSVVMRLVSSEDTNASALKGRLDQASTILGSLNGRLAAEAKMFSGAPAASSALNSARTLISGSGDALQPRIQSAAQDLSVGVVRVAEDVPVGCDLHPVVQERTFVKWGPSTWGQRDGAPLAYSGGELGFYANRPVQLDLTGLATGGQDLLESAARRAANARLQAQAGLTMVDPTFNPAVQALQATDPNGAARLASDAGLIKDDLGQVAGLLPDQVTQTVDVGGASGAGRLQTAVKTGSEKISALAVKVDQDRLTYPDGAARDALVNDMSAASTNAGDAMSSANSLTGGASDSLVSLTGSARSATYALDELCDSHAQLKTLAGQAK